MKWRLYSRDKVSFLSHLQHYVHKSFLLSGFNKENKTGAYSFETSLFSIAIVSFSMHITLCVMCIGFLDSLVLLVECQWEDEVRRRTPRAAMICIVRVGFWNTPVLNV